MANKPEATALEEAMFGGPTGTIGMPQAPQHMLDAGYAEMPQPTDVQRSGAAFMPQPSRALDQAGAMNMPQPTSDMRMLDASGIVGMPQPEPVKRKVGKDVIKAVVAALQSGAGSETGFTKASSTDSKALLNLPEADREEAIRIIDSLTDGTDENRESAFSPMVLSPSDSSPRSGMIRGNVDLRGSLRDSPRTTSPINFK